MKKYIPLLLIPLIINCSENTEQVEEFEDPTEANAPSPFVGVYHFGQSEMESSLVVGGDRDNYFAQIRSGSFNEDGTAWIWNYQTLQNVRIEGDQFYSDKTNGAFVMDNEGKPQLRVEKSWSATADDDGSEMGYYSSSVSDYYSGKHREASMRSLNEDDLSAYAKSDLQIMRNEIYARYGYQFKAGGEMDNYFKTQKWYDPQHNNVDAYLTHIEKSNIDLIKKVEKTAIDIDVEITMNDFPKEWIGLSKKGDGTLYIDEPCLAYNHKIIIEQHNNIFYVTMVKPFDAVQLDLHSFSLKGNSTSKLYQGYIRFENQDAEGGPPEELPLVWNQEEHWLKLTQSDGFEVFYVSKPHTVEYEIIKESPCDEEEHY